MVILKLKFWRKKKLDHNKIQQKKSLKIVLLLKQDKKL